jgi:hypothetical protein
VVNAGGAHAFEARAGGDELIRVSLGYAVSGNLEERAMRPYVVVLLAAGCATQPSPPPTAQPEWTWQKAGASPQEFGVDRGQCQAQAMGVPGLSYFQIAGVYIDCLNSKGWQQVPR